MCLQVRLQLGLLVGLIGLHAGLLGKAQEGIAGTLDDPSAACPGSAMAAEALMKTILGELPLKTFFQDYWGEKPVTIKGDKLGRTYRHLWSEAEMSDTIAKNSTLSKRFQKGKSPKFFHELRVLNPPEGADLPAKGADADLLIGRLQGLLEKGATVVWDNMQDFWKPVYDLVSGLEQYLEMPLKGNMYLTHKGHTGVKLHWDSTYVFFVQVSGRKRWRVWTPFIQDVLPFTHETAHNIVMTQRDRDTWLATQTLLLDQILEPGDVMYIPRGFLHEGNVPSGDEGGSMHLTICPRGADAVANWMSLFERTPYVDLSEQPKPPGFAKNDTPTTGYVPDAEFVQQVTGGIPLAFRRELPPRLSHRCNTPVFKKSVIKMLHKLNPEVSKRDILENIKRVSDKAVEESCHAFTATLLNQLLAEPKDLGDRAESNVGWDTPLCVRSALAARVPASWLIPATDESIGVDGMLMYQDVNRTCPGCGQERPDELKIPGWLSPALRAALHAERNPGGAILPKDLLAGPSAESGRKNQVLAVVQQLVDLKILVPQFPLKEGSHISAPHTEL